MGVPNIGILWYSVKAAILGLVLVAVFSACIGVAYSYSWDIPEWIKNNAGWWSDGKISDDEFLKGIEFLIKNNIILVPDGSMEELKRDKEMAESMYNTLKLEHEKTTTELEELKKQLDYKVEKTVKVTADEDDCKIVLVNRSDHDLSVSEFETLVNSYDFVLCGGSLHHKALWDDGYSNSWMLHSVINRLYKEIVDRYCYDVITESERLFECTIAFDKNKYDILSNISFQCKKTHYDDPNRENECYFKTGIVEIQKVGTKYIYEHYSSVKIMTES